MVNLRWDIANMLTIWLMVALLFVAVGAVKSVIGGASNMQASDNA